MPFRTSGVTPPVKTSIDGCPDWVTLLPNQGILAGSAPVENQGRTFVCTYHITKFGGRIESYVLRLAVGSSGAISSLSLPSPDKLSLTVGTYHGAALPGAAGGIGPYTYSFTCAGGELPSGMGFAPVTRVFAGTPDARFRDSCTYTATDSSQPAMTVSRAVEVEVGRAVTLSLPSTGKLSLTVGTYHGAALPGAAGGIGPYTYSFTCAGGELPSGMGFAPETRVFAGTPDARFRDSCTYTATDSSQPTMTVSRAIEVEVSGRTATPLSIPEDFVLNSPQDALVSLKMGQRAEVTFKAAEGGVQPYTYELLGCELPPGLRFSPNARTLSGSPLEAYRGPDCTYQVTDSALTPASFSRDFALIVDPLDLGTWRFRARTVEPGGPCVLPNPGTRTDIAILPHAHGGEVGEDVYELLDRPHIPFLEFDPITRQLTYIHPSTVPILGTPNTYRYLVGTAGVSAENADDALCLDVQFNPGGDFCPDPSGDLEPDHFVHIQLHVRDDAYHDGSEFRCPDATAPAPRSATQSVSNPVHTALAPVHARRALDVAHDTVRDRVRSWSPENPRMLTAISPAIGLASLSGQTDGFDYTGLSEALSAGAELGAASWQAGVVASFARTDLHYRAEASLSERGYLAGEHNTEILSLHSFAAWHASSGGHFWVSLGAGMGELRHRDDLGFPSWSRSDVRLLAYDVGASVPVADVLSGELQAEAGIESFALEIEGGGNISSSLPTMRGLDYRAGLTWNAPLPGEPSISMAYKHLTGDGPEGGALEAQGSVSIAEFFDPRISLAGSAEASFGLGNHDQNLWGLGLGLRFAHDDLRRGFGLNLDTRLMSLANERSSDMSIRGEAGYGMWGGPIFGTVRPYVGVVRRLGYQSVQQTLGIDLHETVNSTIKVEVSDYSRDRLRAIMFTLRHRL